MQASDQMSDTFNFIDLSNHNWKVKKTWQHNISLRKIKFPV